MTYTTEELRKLQEFYGERAMEMLLKWGDDVESIGRPDGRRRWVDLGGEVRPARFPIELWDSNDAALILRPERRKAKVTQFVFTPLTDKPRHLRAGDWYMTGVGVAYQFSELGRPSPTIPYKRTTVEVEIEVEEQDV